MDGDYLVVRGYQRGTTSESRIKGIQNAASYWNAHRTLEIQGLRHINRDMLGNYRRLENEL